MSDVLDEEDVVDDEDELLDDLDADPIGPLASERPSVPIVPALLTALALVAGGLGAAWRFFGLEGLAVAGLVLLLIPTVVWSLRRAGEFGGGLITGAERRGRAASVRRALGRMLGGGRRGRSGGPSGGGAGRRLLGGRAVGGGRSGRSSGRSGRGRGLSGLGGGRARRSRGGSGGRRGGGRGHSIGRRRPRLGAGHWPLSRRGRRHRDPKHTIADPPQGSGAPGRRPWWRHAWGSAAGLPGRARRAAGRWRDRDAHMTRRVVERLWDAAARAGRKIGHGVGAAWRASSGPGVRAMWTGIRSTRPAGFHSGLIAALAVLRLGPSRARRFGAHLGRQATVAVAGRAGRVWRRLRPHRAEGTPDPSHGPEGPAPAPATEDDGEPSAPPTQTAPVGAPSAGTERSTPDVALTEFEEPQTVAEYASILDQQAEAAEEMQARTAIFRALAETDLPLNPETREQVEQVSALLSASADLLIALPGVYRAALDV